MAYIPLYEVIYVNFAVIFLSFSAVLALYAAAHVFWRAFAERELQKSRCVRFSADTVEIFAECESLEYLFRLALALPMKIKVYIGEDEEAECIAETLARFYDFEIVRV